MQIMCRSGGKRKKGEKSILSIRFFCLLLQFGFLSLSFLSCFMTACWVHHCQLQHDKSHIVGRWKNERTKCTFLCFDYFLLSNHFKCTNERPIGVLSAIIWTSGSFKQKQMSESDFDKKERSWECKFYYYWSL